MENVILRLLDKELMSVKISTEPMPADYDYKAQPDSTELSHIPGTFGLPVLGHLPWIFNDLRALSNKLLDKYGTIAKLNIAGSKGIFVSNPDVVQAVFLDRHRNFSNEKAMENNIGRFFSGGLLLIDFDEHKEQRRLFQTAFKNEPMKQYVKQMNVIFAEHIQRWGDVDEFKFFPHIKQCLLTTAASIFIGVKSDEDVEMLNRNFIDMFEGMVGIVQKEIPGTKWARAKAALRNLKDHYESLIPLRRDTEVSVDFLSYLSKEKREDGSYFSDQQIVDHINFLLMAAHDTTASSLTNILMELAKNTEWQQRLREQSLAMDKEFIAYADLDEMVDFDHVILEAQRLHPSIPMTWRRSIRECEIEGYTIPPNTLVYMPLLYNYRDPKWWTNPDQFDPDRFSTQRAEHKNHSFAFTAFGGGAHKCIGMHFAKAQVKCFLHQFLLTYRFTVSEGYNPKLMMIPMPKPKDDLPLILERIQ